MTIVYLYLGIGMLVAVVAAALIAVRYRAKVYKPAVAIHGRAAFGEDALLLAVLAAIIAVGWLPLGAAFAALKVRGAARERRGRGRNPTAIA